MSKDFPSGFTFGTKAENLRQLVGSCELIEIPDFITIRLGDWHANPVAVAEKIQERFTEPVIVRSTAPDEDGAEQSWIGYFESVANVDPMDTIALHDAIKAVQDSYFQVYSDVIDHHVLVQKMALETKGSGVILTRDPTSGAPYYVISHDDTASQTANVTTGASGRVVKILKSKACQSQEIKPLEKLLIEQSEILECLTRSDALNIEYAIASDGTVLLLQVRRLVGLPVVNDVAFFEAFNNAVLDLQESFERPVASVGARTCYSDMCDWNPAEMIGSRPQKLAYSLYHTIFLHKAWREGRAVLGYRNPHPHSLLRAFGGHPYIDVRHCFNSLVPARVPDALADKVVSACIDVLEQSPAAHDKVEFEVIPSCLTLDFDTLSTNRFRETHLTEDEISAFRADLLILTNRVVGEQDVSLQDTEKSIRSSDAFLNTHDQTLRRGGSSAGQVSSLLHACVENVAKPFSTAVRCFFVGNALLKSAVREDCLLSEEYSGFYGSIETVTSDFVHDTDLLAKGQLAKEVYLERYGHLRPGTYDISIKPYNEMDSYFTNSVPAAELGRAKAESFAISSSRIDEINAKFLAMGYTFSFDDLLDFTSRASQAREILKFQLSKYINRVFDICENLAEDYIVKPEALVHLDIRDVIRSEHEPASVQKKVFLDSVSGGAEESLRLSNFECPELLFKPEDLMRVERNLARPNFVSQQIVSAECISLTAGSGTDGDFDFDSLNGRICLIESCDPGYDWIFTKGVVGLVTKYGGAASHMALRAAELNLPAAIGCGSAIFSALESGKITILDCRNQNITQP